jgi:hypothetical protein
VPLLLKKNNSMLIYKTKPGERCPALVIPKWGDVDNLAVDIFIDTPQHTTRLFYVYNLPLFWAAYKRNINWLEHDCGVLPEYFADRLLGGVRAIKVVTTARQPVLIKLQPIYDTVRKNG